MSCETVIDGPLEGEPRPTIDTLLEEQAKAKALRAELAERIKAFGRCADKTQWNRLQELHADMANAKVRLRAANMAVVEARKAMQRQGPRRPKVEKPDVDRQRGPVPLTTGQRLRKQARRMIRAIERLKHPEPFTLEFLQALRRYKGEQDEHVASYFTSRMASCPESPTGSPARVAGPAEQVEVGSAPADSPTGSR